MREWKQQLPWKKDNTAVSVPYRLLCSHSSYSAVVCFWWCSPWGSVRFMQIVIACKKGCTLGVMYVVFLDSGSLGNLL